MVVFVFCVEGACCVDGAEVHGLLQVMCIEMSCRNAQKSRCTSHESMTYATREESLCTSFLTFFVQRSGEPLYLCIVDIIH